MRFRTVQGMVFALAAVLLMAVPAHAAPIIWATNVDHIDNNNVPGEFSADPYGGTFPAPFPITFATLADAHNAVIGAPNNVFLSLPGSSTTDLESFPTDGVFVTFGTTFTHETRLHVVEVGNT